jgi:2-alkyl-3-oxoalkanoate reductase
LSRYRVASLRPLSGFDLTAAREKLNWQPRVGVRAGLQEIYPKSGAGKDSPAA